MRKIRVFMICFVLVWLATGVTGFGENPWLIRINIPEFKLYLYQGKTVYQVFDIAVGRHEKPSPQGEFWVANKVLNPTWYPTDGKPPVPAGPENPLGKYWLGLNIEGYGIHGNTAAWSIGSPVSLGCFRLHNQDIQKLFGLVPVGTPVQIIYETVHAGLTRDNGAWVEVFPDIYNLVDSQTEISNAIQRLEWMYEPHWGALKELLNAKKPLKVEVPRVIKVEGESLDIDGFYWGNELYIAQRSLNLLPVNIKIHSGSFFNGYVKLDTEYSLGEDPQYFWDRDANTLRIIRLKVLLNGMELSNTLRWGKDRQVLVNLKTIAHQLGANFSWDNISDVATCNGIMIAGELQEGCFWVAPEELERVWPELRSHWNEKSGILDLDKG
jgi:L,D-transpeptidase catalytic domain